MKKILMAFDGSHFSDGAFNFVKALNERSPVLVTGVFLPQVYYSSLWNFTGSINDVAFSPLLEGEDNEAVGQTIDRFESLCKRENIEYRVHKDFDDFAVSGLKKETRFADLVLLGSETFYENLGTNDPNVYLQEAIHEVECPAIVLPESYIFPKTNIIAYDGSESSVYALKQFAYLFPELSTNPTTLVYAKQGGSKALPEEMNIEELAARHYPDLTITNLEMDSKNYFSDWILEKKSAILITGAFGRSSFSLIFKRSFITEIIKAHKLPVFIAHR